MEKIKRPRGTMDIMEPEINTWKYIESTVRRVAENFGFGEIRTPAFEELGLFARGVGEGTDVVQKEMYAFEDKEGRRFALRPEGTAGVVRAVIENGKCSDTLPLKYFYLINCFRYEKPQAGRSREFFQFGTEMLGSADPAADFTVISLAAAVIRELGLRDVKLHINSIGCPSCRPAYREALKEYLTSHRDELCDTCKSRLETNPLRILDCKNEECKKIGDGAPKTVEHLCPDCAQHLESLKKYLDACGVDYVIDPRIVRGLDYYTRTVFEFIAEGIGAQSTVCGGGRYDGLVKELGGPEMPACGFAMGITRLILAMEQCGVEIPGKSRPELYTAALGESARAYGLALTDSLRAAGIKAECDVSGRSLKAQMKYADKIGAKRTLIIGDSEVESRRAMLKNMETSEQTQVKLDSLADVLTDEIGK